MRKLKLSILFMGLVGGLMSLPGFAVELNVGNITQDPFNCEVDATECSFSGLNITAIAANTFVYHSGLITLDIAYNHISNIENEALSGLSRLIQLGLNDNQISVVENGVFSDLSGLSYLNLSYNQISSIEDGAFSGLSSLGMLGLSDNQLTSFPVGLFSGLNMEYLMLDNNSIDDIGGLFNGVSLKYVSLSGNQITDIDMSHFQGSTGMEILMLSNNQITSIDASDFQGLTDLEYLILDHNNICTIASGSFDDLMNITYLLVNDNYLDVDRVDASIATILDAAWHPDLINQGYPNWRYSQTVGMCDPYNVGAYVDLVLTPDSQSAISGTVVNFDVIVTNNTGIDVYLLQDFSNEVIYNNASVTPTNNPALIIGTETNPRWLLSAGETLNLEIEAIVDVLSFTGLEVFSNIVALDDYSLVYTSAVSMIEPIGDVLVEKTLVGGEPQFTGDEVLYSVMVSNIGSDMITGVELVDVWPSEALIFSNQASVNGMMQIPTIYNGIANNYLFEIGDLAPGQLVEVLMTGTMDLELSVGQEFVNTAFVLMDQDQYDTENDTSDAINHVLGLADVYVDVTQISQNPTMIGDKVVYSLVYGNMGSNGATGVELKDRLADVVSFESASIQPDVENNGELIWNLGSLIEGEVGEIILTGSFLGGVQAGEMFVNTGEISTLDIELDYDNNTDVATGEVVVVSELNIKLHATNLTDDSRNIDPDTNINAISGDVVLLEIFVNNSGNIVEIVDVSVSNINGFVGYNGLTNWNITVSPQTSQNIILTGLVGPQNFSGFTPVASMTYSGILLSDDVIINEPLECGDGLITQTEQCDTNGNIGNMLPGQSCQEIGGMCTVVTEGILNVVHMEYVTSLGTGGLSSSVLVDYEMALPDMQCESLTSDFGVVVVDEDNQGDMEFTCNTVDGLQAQEIRIDCGNGDENTGYGVSSFSYDCSYEYDEDGGENDNLYTAQCFVNDSNVVNDSCEKTIAVGEGFYGVCGDGELDDGEECDYEDKEDDKVRIGRYLNDVGVRYDSDNDEGNYCKRCKIRDNDNNYVYQPPQCLMVNTTISIMEDEVMPFWWRLWERDNLKVKDDYDCDDIDDDEEKTIIDKDSMVCHFEVYDGNDHKQEDENYIERFSQDCFDEDDGSIFDYFEYKYKVDFDKVSGRRVGDFEDVLGEVVDTYGEYKIVLKDVEYEYCSPETQNWEHGRLYEGVCEVNFAVTKPYIMQISTLGVDPTASSAVDFLEDFYDIEGNDLIESTDIRDTMEVDGDDYEFDSATTIEMVKFKDQYESLAIGVDGSFEVGNNKTISDIFGGASVKKVPNKLIFFVDGNGGDLVLKQLTDNFPGTSFTIYVEGMDVYVEGSVLTNGMILTDQKIYFEDEENDNRCADGGQVVQGIFVAEGGFDAKAKMRNEDEDDERCAWGNLHVKGVLIGGGLDDLMEKKRSHLNEWFDSTTTNENRLKRERRSEIFEGASVLIEYSPELWSDLPPGAELFIETLDVYKR